MTSHIFIYHDLGASTESVEKLLDFAQKKKYSATCVSGADIGKNNILHGQSLLIIPGGRSLPFYKTLGESGDQAIKTFVEQGGYYLGLCAGAYYAAQKTIFAKDLPLELQLPGTLNFFSGNAVGPVFAESDFAYHSEKGARTVDVELEDGTQFPMYFNGGCYFEHAEQFQNTQVVARYVDNALPAIIFCSVGAGRVLLSGVHPELSFPEISNHFIFLEQLISNFFGVLR
ncbi:MAG: hypothetical protein COY58_07235 [Gammaproteobacteria bacterium CG_4_10_14_0_8_um_filter_38_16]|nr:MAG: hypothetical protein COY58_07235 [Gammaproteobacteria bacterium CG_4_10_14_0_8_um_filter_38_16]PJA04004.1 MAG: hypothetical protein COX72_02065 [Gammaproteobacteria bacterium CG_4_10_14_0_2_um_filter_38_22]PJB11016.1 MAG: hypothetical protein CO120_01840 [Gammaproteobacteria bacterium CG_4_9_14_3_um_filter_38_9]